MNMLQGTLSREPHSTIRSGELCQICDKSSPQTPKIPPDSHRSQPRKNAHKSLPLLDLRAIASNHPMSSSATSGASPRHRSESISMAGFSNGGAIEPLLEERYLRTASIIDQEAINRQPVAIVGVGAIGSHPAEMLAKLGVRDFTLIDPDEVDTVILPSRDSTKARSRARR
jgi:hypothetical protein